MRREFKQMVLVNAVFVVLYLLWNWAEYSGINAISSPTYAYSYFPLYIQYVGSGHAVQVFSDVNFGLFALLFAIAANLFLAFKIQKQVNDK